MFARHITIQIQPGKMDEAVRIYRESVVPASREQKGCRALHGSELVKHQGAFYEGEVVNAKDPLWRVPARPIL